ncbi:60S ribosomal protein L22-like [Schistocerca gregaria]|uniref:60S ribosomal protein L22-like n=1 Tax=Schistocerca gregaria TaxID=7010 RepID=UPI00211E82C9|nr:60S ribosomal protein L22-like [Schistocerca gregaria]
MTADKRGQRASAVEGRRAPSPSFLSRKSRAAPLRAEPTPKARGSDLRAPAAAAGGREVAAAGPLTLVRRVGLTFTGRQALCRRAAQMPLRATLPPAAAAPGAAWADPASRGPTCGTQGPPAKCGAAWRRVQPSVCVCVRAHARPRRLARAAPCSAVTRRDPAPRLPMAGLRAPADTAKRAPPLLLWG